MFNNPALDIAIGLVFIYAIYSLLATTLTELISTLLNQRGKVLKDGIVQMLDTDFSHPENEANGLSRNLSVSFFKQPEIKYLGRLYKSGKKRIPSYIKPKTFAKGLLNTLGYAYSDTSSLSELKEKLDPNIDTHKFLINLMDEADNNVERFRSLAEDWFNETMGRVAGWYRRRIQIITFVMGLFIAYSLNINTIEIAKQLGQDDEARLEMVNAASNYMSNLAITQTNKPPLYDSLQLMTHEVKEILKETRKSKSIINSSYPKICHNDSGVTWFSYLFGCFITAIALSIGSPFWFDLLNKLIKLRGSGSQELTVSNSSKNNPVG